MTDQPAQPVQPKKKLPIVLIILAAVIAFCVFCVVASVAMDKMGLLPTLTPTAIPSSTPLPTATIPPPTSTTIPSPTLTLTPEPSPTPIPPAELTQQALSALQAEIDQYKTIDPRELATYPDNHIGEMVKVKISIFNLTPPDQLQGWFIGTSDALIVQMREPFSGIYKDDVITVYGIVIGKQCGTNAFGADICQPALMDGFFTK